MSTDRADRPSPAPTRRSEPGVAVLGVAAVLVGQLLINGSRLWLLMDLVGGLVAVGAAATLARRLGAERGRRSLGELANGLIAAGVTGALAMLAVRGPQGRLGSVAYWLVAVSTGIFATLILGDAIRSLLRERSGRTPATAGDRGAVRTVTLAVTVAVLVVATNALLR